MTERKPRTRSLKLSIFVTLAVGLLVALGLYILFEVVATALIDNVYLSEENRKKREKYFAEDLQEYILDLGLTGEDTEDFARWAESNRYVYLMIYQDDRLFFDSGSYEESGIGDSANRPPVDNTPDDETPGGTEDNEPGTDNDQSTGADDSSDIDTGTGITVRFPTREELMKYAEENDAHIVNTADDEVLVVNMADFTEYFYYDMINITAIVIAMIALFVVIMIHYQRVTARISRLAADVRVVAGGDMEHRITAEGRDEISELSTNVEDMRSSILENIEKERAVMEANAELITSMSHDIRTPLTVLLGYIDIMKERVGDDETMSEYIDASEKTALRLKKLSDDLFNYFLLFGSGAKNTVLEEYDVGTLFEQMISEHVLLLRESGYDVRVNMATDLHGRRIKTDPTQLVRIFENLFSNIMKYAEKAAPVSINFEIIDGKLKLLFTNVISRAQYAESNGIGLKSCKKLAERLSAEIGWREENDSFLIELTFDILRV